MKYIYLLRILSMELAVLAFLAFGIVVYQALIPVSARDAGPACVATVDDGHENMAGISLSASSDFHSAVTMNDGISPSAIHGMDSIADEVGLHTPQHVRRGRFYKYNTIGSRLGIPDVVLTDNGSIFDIGRAPGAGREINDQ